MNIFILLFLTTCFLAYSNGANDNFKGVATLFGSRTTNYKWAIGWATLTTEKIVKDKYTDGVTIKIL